MFGKLKGRKKRGVRSGVYLFCAVLLLMLVAAAFILPQMVLVLQDKGNMARIYLSDRNSLDYAAADIEYTMDVFERLAAYAAGHEAGRQYFITSSSDTDNINDSELTEGITKQEWFWLLMDMGIFDSKGIVYDADAVMQNIEVLKKEYFVIYNDDTSAGASFVCWYLQLSLEGVFDMNVLVDAKDNTLYYAEIYSNFSKYVHYEREYYMTMDQMLYVPDMFRYFYKADESGVEISSDSAAMGYDEKTINENALIKEGQTRAGELRNEIYFKGSPLNLSVYLTDDKQQGFPGICMGIQEIIDLLPEDRKAVKLEIIN